MFQPRTRLCLFASGLLGIALSGPAGAQPTMRTPLSVNGADSRIPISSLPYTIDRSGSYYLTDHLTGTAGITVDAPYVTIDLNGYGLQGQGNSGSAILCATANGGGASLRVHDGSLSNWDGWAISVPDGIPRQVIENVTVGACDGGFNLADNAIVRDCSLTGIGSARGIRTGENCIVRDCIVEKTSGNGCYWVNSGTLVQNCIGIGSGSNVFEVRIPSQDVVFSNCVARNGAGNGFRANAGAVFTDCISSGNTQDGFLGANMQMTNCRARSNGGAGFDLQNSTVFHSMAQDNPIGFDLASNCMLSHTFSSGSSSHAASNGLKNDYVLTQFGGWARVILGVGDAIDDLTDGYIYYQEMSGRRWQGDPAGVGSRDYGQSWVGIR